MDFNVEIQRITLKNISDKTKNIKLYSFVEWAFYNAIDDMTNFQRNLSIGEVEVSRPEIALHKKRNVMKEKDIFIK